MKRGYFFKVKLDPGLHTFRSDTGEPVTINIEAGRIYYLTVKESSHFPKVRATIVIDDGRIGPQCYRLPKILDLKPLETKHIKDHSKVIIGN
jgi:hypothetical protein